VIIKFKQFIKEELSGTELIGPVGPAFGETSVQNKTIDSDDTNIIYCELDGNLYTLDQYLNLYSQYLKSGGSKKPLSGFNSENLNYLVNYLKTI
jgi:hypothetical protein